MGQRGRGPQLQQLSVGIPSKTYISHRLIDGVANVHTVPKEKWCPHFTVRIWGAACPSLSGARIKTVSGFCKLATRWSSQPYKYLSLLRLLARGMGSAG